MNIAIVDDLASDRLQLIGKLQTYMQQARIPFTLYEFDSGEAFLEAFSPGRFSIVFLDIYMGGMTGMSVAHAIREQDFDCRLIFLTQSEEYLREGYSVNAVHYLIKPVSDPYFTQAMRFCRLTSSPQPVYLDVISSGTPIHLDTSNIVYINLQKRIVHIHTLKHTLPVTGTFTRVTEPLLSDPRFLLCIQGVLVNMDMIVDQPGSTFLMKNGDAVQINLRKKRSSVQAYRQYIFESMSENR